MARRRKYRWIGGRWLTAVMLGGVVIAVGFVVMLIRLEAIREGYRLSSLRRQVAELRGQRRALTLQAARLKSRQRLVRIARDYGMGPPVPSQIRTLK